MEIKEILENKKKGEIVSITVAIVDSEIKQTKNGDTYLNLDVVDKTGRITCKKWNESVVGDFEADTVVDIKGSVGEFNGVKNIAIEEIRRNDSVHLDTFSSFDVTLAEATLDKILSFIDENVDDVPIKDVTKYILEKYRKDFVKSVAAVKHHHSELGGLLQHSREVLAICRSICPTLKSLYEIDINKNLIFCGAILHDIGKVDSYVTRVTCGNMSTAGKLLDHITLSTLIVNEAYSVLNVDKDSDYMGLLHIIVSHHMLKEWGSMVEPLTMEAHIIHFADNMSAKLRVISKSIKESSPESEWAKNCYSYGEFYKTIT